VFLFYPLVHSNFVSYRNGGDEFIVIIKDYTDAKKKEVALIENIQREDLNIVEIAEALKELMNIESYTVADVAKVTGKSTSGVSNTLRLLKLPLKVREYILEGKLFEGQARAILAIEEEEEQIRIADKIIEKKLTVREVEKLIYDDSKYNVKKKKTVKKHGAIYKVIEDKLTEYFGVKTRIDLTRKKQRLVLEYLDNDGLQSILDKLKIDL
jgi:ParB family chromosome partitioning protein